MQVWSLSSGSSGNCYLVREGGHLVVLDAGVAAARVEREIVGLGFAPSQVAAVVVSHEHADHWSSALALARRFAAPLLCSRGTWREAGPRSRDVEHAPLVPGLPVAIGSLSVEAFPLPHDAQEPVGFVLRSPGAVVCVATDMGTVTEEVLERARQADLVIVEANHDLRMLVDGPYPAHLKARILGERGHISNEAAAQSIAGMVTGRPRQFWLAHLSQVNNSPRLALSSVEAVLRREGVDHVGVGVALRDRRSLFWDSEGKLEQLPLFSV